MKARSNKSWKPADLSKSLSAISYPSEISRLLSVHGAGLAFLIKKFALFLCVNVVCSLNPALLAACVCVFVQLASSNFSSSFSSITRSNQQCRPRHPAPRQRLHRLPHDPQQVVNEPLPSPKPSHKYLRTPMLKTKQQTPL